MVITAGKSVRAAQQLLSFASLWDVRLGLLPRRGRSRISHNNLCPPRWPLKVRGPDPNQPVVRRREKYCDEEEMEEEVEEEDASLCLFAYSCCLLCEFSLTACLCFIVFAACPPGTFKSTQGPGLCLQCPPNSRSTAEAATVCVCRNGYYRGDADQPDVPCTSELDRRFQHRSSGLCRFSLARQLLFLLLAVILPLCWRASPKVLITWHGAAKL